MATGSHIKGRKRSNRDESYTISYAGKEPDEAVLGGPRATLVAHASFGQAEHDNRLIFGENLSVTTITRSSSSTMLSVSRRA